MTTTSRGYFNIYTNFPHERALSVSHRDAGVNYGKTAGPDSQLLDEKSHDIDLLNMQPLSDMKWYDFCFRKVFPGRIAKELKDIDNILRTMEQQKPVFLVSISEASEKIIRNLICHFERLNIRDCIFMVSQPTSDLLLDLSRKGHPVIDTKSVFDSITGSAKSSPELIRDIVVKANVIKKSLEFEFDTWVFPDNVLPLSKNPVHDTSGLIGDFYVEKGFRHFVARSSSSSRRIWDQTFVQKLADRVESLVGHDGGDIVDVIEMFF